MTNEERLTDEDFKRMFEGMPIVSMKVFEELKNININKLISKL